MIVPSVRVQSRLPGFKEKSLVVISFGTNDLDIFKVHDVAEMALKSFHLFGIPS